MNGSTLHISPAISTIHIENQNANLPPEDVLDVLEHGDIPLRCRLMLRGILEHSLYVARPAAFREAGETDFPVNVSLQFNMTSEAFARFIALKKDLGFIVSETEENLAKGDAPSVSEKPPLYPSPVGE